MKRFPKQAIEMTRALRTVKELRARHVGDIAGAFGVPPNLIHSTVLNPHSFIDDYWNKMSDAMKREEELAVLRGINPPAHAIADRNGQVRSLIDGNWELVGNASSFGIELQDAGPMRLSAELQDGELFARNRIAIRAEMELAFRIHPDVLKILYGGTVA